MTTQICKILFDNENAISAEYVNEPGILPGGGYVVLSPDVFAKIEKERTFIKDDHDLEMSAGKNIKITNLHITSIAQTSTNGPVRVNFQDRRWQWTKYGAITQDFNVLTEDAKAGKEGAGLLDIEPLSAMDGKAKWWGFPEIINELLDAMGEETKSKLPSIPPANLSYVAENPAKIILELIERYNWRIGLNLKEEVVFFKDKPLSTRVSLPKENLISWQDAKETIELPDQIWVVGNRILEQATSKLVPVFIQPPAKWKTSDPVAKDPDAGKVVKLRPLAEAEKEDEKTQGLEYFGWKTMAEAYTSASSKPPFRSLRSIAGLTKDESARRQKIAQNFLFKWWRIVDTEFEYIAEEAYRPIDLTNRIPLKTLNSKTTMPDGTKVRAPIKVVGDVFGIEDDPDLIGKGRHKVLPNEEITYLGTSHLKYRIVTTRDKVTSISEVWGVADPFTEEIYQACAKGVRLTYAYERKGSKNWEDDFYIYKHKETKGDKILYIKMKELFQLRINGEEQNKKQLDKIIKKNVGEFFADLKKTRRGGSARLAGIHAYHPDGEIGSVRWSASSSGVTTSIAYGTNKSAVEGLSTYKDRVHKALTRHRMLIEGAELTRDAGDDASMGTGKFRAGEPGSNFGEAPTELKVHNAHHTGLLPLGGHDITYEEHEIVHFCRVSGYEGNADDHIHKITNIGPLRPSPEPDAQSDLPDGASFYYARCGTNFKTEEGYHGADGYWHIQTKTPYFPDQWEEATL